MTYKTRIAAIAATAVTAIGIGAGLAGTANAAPSTTTLTTHVINRPDSGNGGVWAYVNIKNRVVTVTQDTVNPATTPTGYNAYTAVVTDNGTFVTVEGAGTPNQFVPGTKVTHAVTGTFSGGISYTITAPDGDTLVNSGTTAEENDALATPTGENTTAEWPEKAFTSSANVTVTEGNTWSWTYKTAAGEQWVDSAANGDGNLSTDGNITGLLPKVTKPVPASKDEAYLTDGHVITVNNNDAQIGWSYSTNGWPAGTKYVLTKTFGYDMTNDNGQPHVGFTGGDVGYWGGLAAGHTYDVELIPANAEHQPLPNGQVGWINIVTTK